VRRVWVLAGLLGASLLAPGYPASVFRGVPLGAAGLVAFAVAMFVLVFFRRTRVPARAAGWWTALVVTVTALKVLATIVAPRPGWVSQQYANDRFEPPVRNSLDFRIPGATRIDLAVDFIDDFLPAYYLNEGHFNTGIRREVTTPISIRWTGHIAPKQAVDRTLVLAARGGATLSVDGTPVLVVSPDRLGRSARAAVIFSPGPHELTLAYVKPADTDPLIRLTGLDDDGHGGLAVTAAPATAGRRALLWPIRILATTLDAAVAASFVWLGILIAGAIGRPRWWQPRALALAMFALLAIEGANLSSSHIGRAETLSGGDDWHAYEARAREVFIHGFLMQDPQFPPGHGELYDYPPLYPYYLAGVHWLGGDGLFAPLFSHFMLLFGTNVVIYLIGRRLYGERVAVGAVVALLVLEQIAFVRHYTVNLFTENLYVLLVALIVCWLVQFMDAAKMRTLVWAGLTAGVAILTRPAFSSFLPLGAIVVMAGAWRKRRRVGPVLLAPAVLLVSMLPVVSLAVARNYVVAGEARMFRNIPASSAVEFNLPDAPGSAERYLNHYDGTLAYAVKALFRILVEHPRDFLVSRVGVKLAFSFGALNVMHQNFHPELVLASVAYLLAIVLLPSARARLTWPVHAFVASHLCAMILTMPSNYGYRLILPMYIFFTIFGAALAARALGWRRAGSLGSADAETIAR